MDELSAALSGFLSRPGAMEQLASAAKQLGLQPDSAGEAPEQPTDHPAMPEPPEGISPEMLQKLMSAARDSGGPDQATTFLQALRPLLRPEKQEKLDRAIRAVRMMRTARAVSKTLEL